MSNRWNGSATSGWGRFHSLTSVAAAIDVEAAELQWVERLGQLPEALFLLPGWKTRPSLPLKVEPVLSPRRLCHQDDLPEHEFGGMTGEVSSLESRLDVLRLAAPAATVEVASDSEATSGPWSFQDRARATLEGAASVRYAYLDSRGGLALRLYVGDTLTQARALYRNRSAVEGLLALADRGWELIPHFHFGFMQKGFVWTRSRLLPADYARYWLQRIEATAEIRRSEWSAELRRLVADGVLAEADLVEFDRRFTNTGRQTASPRPTIRIARVLSPAVASVTAAAAEVADHLKQALVALEEPLDEMAPIERRSFFGAI